MDCSVEDCTRTAKYAKTGWCQTHYHRWWRTGVSNGLKQPHRAKGADCRSQWKGDEIAYRTAHARVRSLFGKAAQYACIACGGCAKEWAYDGTDSSERAGLVRVQGIDYPVTFSVWPEFYMPMCFPCHRKMDAGARATRRTECIAGHAMTPENTYERPSRPGTRECRTCRAENSRQRYLVRMGRACSALENSPENENRFWGSKQNRMS